MYEQPRQRSLAALALIASTLLAACATPAARDSRTPASPLVVLSYNIHYGVGMDDALDLERIAAVITAESPDLVGLQEIGNRAMAEELGRLTGMTAVFGPS